MALGVAPRPKPQMPEHRMAEYLQKKFHRANIKTLFVHIFFGRINLFRIFAAINLTNSFT